MSGEGDHCAYCGLPCAPAPSPSEAPYCCLGCRFAAAVTKERGEVGQIRWTLTRLGLAVFFTMNVMLFAMALWARDLFPAPPGDEAALADAWDSLFRSLCLLFASPVMVLLGLPLFDEVLGQLRRRQITTDLLLVIGVAAAFTASMISYWRDAGHVYFEVSCMVLVAVTLGRWLEAVGKQKTTESLVGLQSLMPDQVTRIDSSGPQEVAPSAIQPGDRLSIRPGERIAVDGVVRRGTAAVDRQLITGESEPVMVVPGSEVVAGSVDLDGDLIVEATSPGDEGTLASLIRRVREATAAKDCYRKLADRIAGWFLPVVFIGSLAVFAWHAHQSGVQAGIQAGLAVVLISCPCALGLATPLAVATAIGTAARHQVLFRDGDAMARLASIRAMAFDKTGTLTQGVCRVKEVAGRTGTPAHSLAQWIEPLVRSSPHPHASAIREHALLPGFDHTPPAYVSVRQLPGRGIVGEREDGTTVRLGNIDWLIETGADVDSHLRTRWNDALQSGWTVTAAAWDGEVQVLFLLCDEPRRDVPEMLQQVRDLGVAPFVLTGDDRGRAELTCAAWDLPVMAQLLPEDKAEAVERARRQHGPVAMVGDGLNDTIALATADVGIALQAASDLARQTAEVCILGNDLRRIPFAIQLARATERAIRANLFWAFAYNSIGIGLAATGVLHPIVAAAAMLGSSLFVIGRSLTLARCSPWEAHQVPAPSQRAEPGEPDRPKEARPIDEPTTPLPEAIT